VCVCVYVCVCVCVVWACVCECVCMCFEVLQKGKRWNEPWRSKQLATFCMCCCLHMRSEWKYIVCLQELQITLKILLGACTYVGFAITIHILGACTYAGSPRTINIQCIYGIFGRDITKYTVKYGIYKLSWPTLHIWGDRANTEFVWKYSPLLV
jgi:hypothetical protein